MVIGHHLQLPFPLCHLIIYIYVCLWDFRLSLAIFGDLHAYHINTHARLGQNENIMLHFIKTETGRTFEDIPTSLNALQPLKID